MTENSFEAMAEEFRPQLQLWVSEYMSDYRFEQLPQAGNVEQMAQHVGFRALGYGARVGNRQAHAHRDRLEAEARKRRQGLAEGARCALMALERWVPMDQLDILEEVRDALVKLGGV
jgi:hypothetical protein